MSRSEVNGLDPECKSLVSAMNLLSGIETFESCCGHNEHPFRIWFWAENLECLPQLLYWFDSCHCGCRGWSVYVKTDCSMKPAVFVATGPTGPQAYRDAEVIAGYIRGYARSLEHEQE